MTPHSTPISSLVDDHSDTRSGHVSVFRSGSWRVWNLFFAACLGIPMIWAVKDIAIEGRSTKGDLHPMPLRVGAVVAHALVLLFAARVARAGVALDDGGVTVRNVFRDRRLAWSDVRAVSLQPHRV